MDWTTTGVGLMSNDERIAELEEQVKKLKSLVADLQTVIDEIPPFSKVWGAVLELQENMDAPAANLIHYLGGRW